jgi:hypothetical protein
MGQPKTINLAELKAYVRGLEAHPESAVLICLTDESGRECWASCPVAPRSTVSCAVTVSLLLRVLLPC